MAKANRLRSRRPTTSRLSAAALRSCCLGTRSVNLFAACTVAKISLDRIVTQLVPLVGVVLTCLMMITYVPRISLFLRDTVYAK